MAVMWPILLFDKYSWKMRKTILFLAAALVGTSAITARQMTIDNKLRYAGKIVESFYVDSINSDSIAEEAIRAAVKDYYDRQGIAYNPKDFPDCGSCEGCHG